MPLTAPTPRQAADMAAEVTRTLAYWSPPTVPQPASRSLTAIEVMYAYFGSDRA